MKTRRSIRRDVKPTSSESRILAMLWRRGPLTVRQVNDELSADAPVAYTTTLKFLQIMHEKGLVTRDDSLRSHVFAAAVDESAVKRAAAGELLTRLFDGSASSLIMHALAARPASREELRRIRKLIAEMEKESAADV